MARIDLDNVPDVRSDLESDAISLPNGWFVRRVRTQQGYSPTWWLWQNGNYRIPDLAWDNPLEAIAAVGDEIRRREAQDRHDRG